ncbi:MAG: hypothetical protein EOT05_02275 [Candidatus Microsaccharimonas sossegonensis]|uniref:Uncharacterized protein n=1 Tax=Candidatus Microsaccharimonas sossegonensis TaxID=2506948 RepID=A0A4Q0AHH3_9BACT|nr:MAG: hypothetical protein EOT05_02275 [Candidatus Microsaccharimonas sossegonensis]
MLANTYKHMSILNFLQLQPVEPTDDDTVSPLDEYEHDETIDLNADIDESVLDEELDMVINDLKTDPEKLTFSDQ